ncbi:H2O-forming NADH oxidase [Fusibacter ferrireducens]|uniref:NADH oxidase n=1 Tax=Fusibacter ferrireducens TaxID=2785058 RepID=A0ABR9ZQ16_9FIRM|nr:FAD-dependent oxidoreductase [Fusibacter ferrireducens]MBF4692223.1 FAD-dependent oxidoreductase [Fusibacter ferrireducens]
MKKVVIVGTNHAGTAATNTILDNSNNHQVTVFDSNNNISFLGCGMALWIGNQIAGPEGLFYSNKETLESKGAKVYMETPVNKIDFNAKVVYGKNAHGEIIEEHYDDLILATGSLPIIPKIQGMELENVQKVKLYQHAEVVIEKLKNPEIRDVVVVGAGYIGVELAEAFERHGKNVTLIDIATTSLPAYYDAPFTQMMNENLSSHGIKLAFGETVQKLEGDGKVERVVTDKATHKADMVVMAIGFRPNTELGAEHLDQFRNGAYLVNKKQETSIPNVYAIGDCATVYDNSIDNTSYIALATNAVRSAIVAAHNVIGNDIDSAGVQGSNGIAIYDLKMVSTGITAERAKLLGLDVLYTDFEDLQKPEFITEENHKVKLRIVYDAKTRIILGAQMASQHDMSMGIHLFSLAIQEKVTIDKLALTDLFFLPHFNKPYNYVTMAAITAK